MVLTSISTVTVYAAPQRDQLEFELITLGWFPLHLKGSQLIVEYLKDVGIKINLKGLDSPEFYGSIYDERNFDFYVQASALNPSTKDQFRRFHSDLDVTPGASTSNHFGLHDAAMDALIDEISGSKTEQAAKEEIWEAEKLMTELLPLIPTFVGSETHVIRKEWVDYEMMPGGPLYIHNRLTPLNIHRSDAPTGGDFTIAFPGDIDQQNVLLAMNHRDILVLNTFVYDTLTSLHWTGTTFETAPWLAESWTSSEDGTTWTFNLVHNAVWHDGEPLTSEDVKFTIEYCLENDIALYAPDLQYITSIETPDDYTVVIQLSQPYCWFLSALTGASMGGLPIVPKHIWEDKVPDWQPETPIGSGPFKWVTRIPGEYIEVEKNPNYWQAGKPRVDRIKMPIISAAEARFMAMQTGEADTERYETSPTLLKQVMEDPNLEFVVAAGIWDQMLAINLRRPPLDDIKLRKAMAYAINHQDMIDKIMLGWGEFSYTVLFESWHGDLYTPDITTYPYNVTIANQMLDDAGYIDTDGDGVREVPGAVVYELPGALATIAIFSVVVIVTPVYYKRRQ